MDLVSYINRKVHVILLTGYFYIGKVVEADENSLTLIDRRGVRVSVSKQSIETLKEVFA